jgi:hypothetical protein
LKKILYFNLLLLFLIALVGCGSENNPTTEVPTDGQTEEQKTPVEKTPVEEVDYGKVTFNNVKVFSDEFDGVSLKYTFTNPDVCVNEVFDFEISNEKICYIEDGKVYFLSEGMTRVKAVSQNLTAYFNVVCQNYRITSQSKTQLNKLKNNFKDGDTLFLGDSFFEFWRNKTGIAENFDTAFSQYAVFNIGISATTTHHWRAINVKMAELDIKPKNIVINIGINNVARHLKKIYIGVDDKAHLCWSNKLNITITLDDCITSVNYSIKEADGTEWSGTATAETTI